MKGNMLFAVINTVKNIFPVSQKFSLCYTKFPVFSLSGKSKNEIPVSLFRGHPGGVNKN